MARELGISRVRLASYEHARAPVRFWLARQITERFDINQRWLAEGKLPIKPRIPFNSSLEDQIPQRELFSAVYQRFLKFGVERRLSFLAAGANTGIKISFPTPVLSLSASVFRNAIQRTIESGSARIPKLLYSDFLIALAQAFLDFEQKHKAEIEKFLLENQSPAKPSATSA